MEWDCPLLKKPPNKTRQAHILSKSLFFTTVSFGPLVKSLLVSPKQTHVLEPRCHRLCTLNKLWRQSRDRQKGPRVGRVFCCHWCLAHANPENHSIFFFLKKSRFLTLDERRLRNEVQLKLCRANQYIFAELKVAAIYVQYLSTKS